MTSQITTARLLTVQALPVAMLMALAPLSFAQRVNFAKYQTATASSQNGDYDPSLAVDGIVSNFHSFRTGPESDPHWLQIQLGKSTQIGSAHLYLGLDNDPTKGLPHFKFQFRNGSGNWVDVPGTETFNNTATELVVPFPTAPTSDRFRLYSDSDGNRIIREVALFPRNLVGGIDQGYPLGTDVRLSLGYERPATASSINSSNYPKYAVDGYVNNTARWLSAGTAIGEYIEIDLLVDHVIGSAHIYSGSNATNAIPAFELRYWNGTAWVVVPGTAIANNTNTALIVPFSSNITTSKIRLRTNSVSPARIQEILLFPPRTGGYPPGQDVVLGDAPSAKWDDYSDSSWRLHNGGPDLRLAVVDGVVRFVAPGNPPELLEWQLLLNHRDGTYRVSHTATGLCLSQTSPASVAGEAVIVESYSALPYQDWKLDFTSTSEFRLINAFSGLTIQSHNSVWADGNTLDLATPGSGVLQRWTPTLSSYFPKKGLAGFDSSFNQFNASWSYKWARDTGTSSPFWHTFNPMQWGNFNFAHGDALGPLDLIRGDLQSSGKPTHLMGFNEPDQTGQANMSVADAIDRWPRLEAMDAPIVAPVPASAFGGWLADFHSQANALGYRRDYTAVHWYSAPSADALIAHLNQNYTTFGRPVWLTEFSTVRYSGSATWTDADNYAFLAEFMWRAESLTWLKRYSLFQFTEGGGNAPDPTAAPRSNARQSSGTLTPFGELYAAWDGIAAVLPQKAYHVQNRQEFERIQNPGGTSAPVFTVPTNSGNATQWTLAPGKTANTSRIVSLRDGRPLRYVNGGAVSHGTVGQSDASVEWRLVENTYGWFFIDHPQTNKRLKDNGDGTFGMVATTSTGNPIQWRLVVPVAPEDAAVPTPPAALTAMPTVNSIQLTWPASASADVTSYRVYRMSPTTLVAQNLTATNWTDAGLPSETTRAYTVAAVDATGFESTPSPQAGGTTLHPYATYSTWVTATFASQPGADTSLTGNPDKDSSVNLLEYAFLTNPLRGEGASFTVSRSSGGAIQLHFPWNWRNTAYTWRIRYGASLPQIAAWPVIAPGTVQTTRVGDIDQMTATPAGITGDTGFFIVEIIPVTP